MRFKKEPSITTTEFSSPTLWSFVNAQGVGPDQQTISTQRGKPHGAEWLASLSEVVKLILEFHTAMLLQQWQSESWFRAASSRIAVLRGNAKAFGPLILSRMILGCREHSRFTTIGAWGRRGIA